MAFEKFLTTEQINQTEEALRARIVIEPRVGLILGSGLGALAESVSQPIHIPFPHIPNWPASTVRGHTGKLVLGVLEGKPVMVMQGRAHYYEGYSISQIGLPIRVMKRLGVEVLIVTNAAGGVNPGFSPGDLMLIQDHLNFMGMAGFNPLRGPNLDEFGVRFPDMSEAYDRDLQGMALEVAAEINLELQRGVYVCLSGPTFETPADLRFLHMAGVDAVGMSTVPEVIVANHSGLRVMGISGISNKANLDGSTITTHEEVLEAGAVIGPKLEALVRGILNRLPIQPENG